MAGSGRILIIDDDFGPREAMRMILKDQYDVSTASSARGGISTLGERDFDVVVLDIKMPDMDGIETLREIKKAHADVEVVMVTAYASLETARSAIKYGALDYLIKPFDKNDVRAVIEKGMEKRRLTTRSRSEFEDLLITNRQLEQQVDNARQNFLLCYEGAIKALIYAIDAKDSYTCSHSEHVADFSTRIAQAVGFSEIMRNNLRQAALVHDIGKIGIDEQILRKNGPLSDMELREIRKHPEIGARIVNSVPFIEETAQVILHHHERFDGNGFPQGLKGENIPLTVRIVTIADAVDSMLRDRPYRKALPNDRLMKELIDGAGKQFDPELIRLITNGSIPILQDNFACRNPHP